MRSFVTVLAALAVLGAIYETWANFTRHAASETQARALASCAASPQAVLQVSDLPGFRLIIDGVMNRLPMHVLPNSPPNQQPIAFRTFVKGRSTGFVVEKAWSQPYLGQSQAYQRQMGYPVTDSPEIPLQGAIVNDTPGILEVFQTNTAYLGTAGAQGFEKTETEGSAKDPAYHRLDLGTSLSQAIAYHMVSSVSSEEDRYQIDLVLRTLEIDVQFRGGKAMAPSEVTSLAKIGLDRLTTACHQALSKGATE